MCVPVCARVLYALLFASSVSGMLAPGISPFLPHYLLLFLSAHESQVDLFCLGFGHSDFIDYSGPSGKESITSLHC